MALTQAGLNKRFLPRLRQMLLVTELEAAAIYTTRYLKELNGAEFFRASLRRGEFNEQ